MKKMRLSVLIASFLLVTAVEAKLASDGPAFCHVCHVVDESGKPVTNAVVHGSINPGYRIDAIPFTGRDLGGGYHELKGTAMAGVSYRVEADGYYTSEGRYSAGIRERGLFTGVRWMPYGQTNTVVLKKVVDPKPLIVKRGYRDPDVPSGSEWVGYDCVIGDVCEPLGRGKVADFLARRDPADKRYPNRQSAELSFTNHPYAGFYALKQDLWSALRSVREADTNAEYRACGAYPETDARDEDRQIVFRTRTRIDRDGRLVSAHYGKIEGCVYFAYGQLCVGKPFFNPVPNDPNLEHYALLERDIYHDVVDFVVPGKEDFLAERTSTNLVTVLGEDGQPLNGASSLCQVINPNWGKDARVVFWAYADGYYLTKGKSKVCEVEKYRRWSDRALLYRWKPAEALTANLRPIRNPQWMINGDGPRLRETEGSDWRALDVERMDWCPPWGKGRVADMLVRWRPKEDEGGERGVGWSLEISFTNVPFAGYYRRERVLGSAFDSDYRADTNAAYRTTAEFTSFADGRRKAEESKLGANEYWVFRTRTKTDAAGRLVSAHYGKLYGPVYASEYGAKIGSLVFNPIPNDPNLEDLGVSLENEKAIRKIRAADR